LLDQRHLVLGRGLGEEVVDAGLLGDGLGGQRVVAGDHHGADAHAPQLVEPLAHALLDDVLEVDHAEHPRVRRRRRAGCRRRRDAVDDAAEVVGDRARPARATQAHRVGRALADDASPSRSTPLMRVCAVNGTSGVR
jgi:hypothetical protein